MGSALRIAAALLLLPGPAGAQASGDGPAASHALAIAREVERAVARGELWPGFEPLSIPLAVFDGERTLLFRHPSPPADFRPVAGADPPAHARDGRHPAVTSNTSAELGGVPTATVMADGPSAARSPAELAAVALHESFHVFQRERHPSWAGNEGVLLLYPVEDGELLTLRRLETAALARAVAASDDALARCLAAEALAYRRERFALLPAAFSAYERASELNEGLAAYVELRALPGARVELPEHGFAPDAVRHRVYATGPALATLLDRFAPGWRAALEEDDAQHLDDLLRAAVERTPTAAVEPPCALPGEEVAAIERRARDEADAVVRRRAERRRAFDERPGWRLVVEAPPDAPLGLLGFDPLNVERVEGGLLHTRMLQLGDARGRLLVLNEGGAELESLTVGAGDHPLFEGVRRVVVAGLAEPVADEVDGRLVVTAPGLTVELAGARLSPGATDTELVLELGASD